MMGTFVYLPYAQIKVDRGQLEAHFDCKFTEIAKLSRLQYQLRQTSLTEPHGLCVMTTYEPVVMWLHGSNLFYRLLFTINTPDQNLDGMKTILQYEVKVYADHLDVIEGWNADNCFPVLATAYYSKTNNLDVRPLFDM